MSPGTKMFAALSEAIVRQFPWRWGANPWRYNQPLTNHWAAPVQLFDTVLVSFSKCPYLPGTRTPLCGEVLLSWPRRCPWAGSSWCGSSWSPWTAGTRWTISSSLYHLANKCSLQKKKNPDPHQNDTDPQLWTLNYSARPIVMKEKGEKSPAFTRF